MNRRTFRLASVSALPPPPPPAAVAAHDMIRLAVMRSDLATKRAELAELITTVGELGYVQWGDDLRQAVRALVDAQRTFDYGKQAVEAGQELAE